MTTLFLIALLAALFAWGDRFAGGGLGWSRLARDHGGPMPGRPLYYVAPVAMAAGALLMGVFGFLAATFWLVYRSLSWDLMDLSAIVPKTGEEVAFAVVRHGLPALGFLGLAAYGWSLWPALFAAAYAASAAVLAWRLGVVELEVIYGDAEPERFTACFARVELTRGAIYGLAIAIAWIMMS